MQYTLSTRRCKANEEISEQLGRFIKKLSHFFPQTRQNLIMLEIIVRKHTKKGKPHIYEDKQELAVRDLERHRFIDSPEYYDGLYKLILPQKPLVVRFEGKSMEEALHAGYHKLFKELETYRGKHMKSYSRYYDHHSMRFGAEYIRL